MRLERDTISGTLGCLDSIGCATGTSRTFGHQSFSVSSRVSWSLLVGGESSPTSVPLYSAGYVTNFPTNFEIGAHFRTTMTARHSRGFSCALHGEPRILPFCLKSANYSTPGPLHVMSPRLGLRLIAYRPGVFLSSLRQRATMPGIHIQGLFLLSEAGDPANTQQAVLFIHLLCTFLCAAHPPAAF
ncbi:hypothetical protein SCHPADRAFT_168225 [Schizopora paradoxa]|uniref:Uncharacterized protein n=1 Tax=Schizopora paradoxa TaxID=27342 RepID=A0A0H2S715_9AGAM|nr:hypothetical protein SCHPADRAFT_168225 [Schizopora paradoxa]